MLCLDDSTPSLDYVIHRVVTYITFANCPSSSPLAHSLSPSLSGSLTLDMESLSKEDLALRVPFSSFMLGHITQLSTTAMTASNLQSLLRVDSSRLIQYSRSSTCYIYFCTLEKTYTGIDHVVCKLSLRKKGTNLLKHEAGIYEQTELTEKLGKQMPRFFGLYESDSDGISIYCMILEYCGSPLGQVSNLLCHQNKVFRYVLK